jgi:hypothetical protein
VHLLTLCLSDILDTLKATLPSLIDESNEETKKKMEANLDAKLKDFQEEILELKKVKEKI